MSIKLLKGLDNNLGNQLTWLNEPKEWELSNGILRVKPDGQTDCIRAMNANISDSAGFLSTTTTGDFTLSAKINVKLVGTFDAGAIAIRANNELWAKLCIERSPAGEVSIVSVVTNQWSDDTNNELLDQSEAYLRITRINNGIGMHYSLDGKKWRFVRKFGLNWPDEVQVGILVQAPVEAGCEVFASELTLSKDTIKDFRSGE